MNKLVEMWNWTLLSVLIYCLVSSNTFSRFWTAKATKWFRQWSLVVLEFSGASFQSESVDFRADIHGGWTLENCKQELNEFVQQSKQSLEYTYAPVGPDHQRYATHSAQLIPHSHSTATSDTSAVYFCSADTLVLLLHILCTYSKRSYSCGFKNTVFGRGR